MFVLALKERMGVTNELLIRITAQMEGVDLQICSSKTNLAKAYFKGMSCYFMIFQLIVSLKETIIFNLRENCY